MDAITSFSNAYALYDWLRQDEREAKVAAVFANCAAELAPGQAQLSPPVSPEQLRRERRSIRANTSIQHEQH